MLKQGGVYGYCQQKTDFFFATTLKKRHFPNPEWERYTKQEQPGLSSIFLATLP
jgi:hypothetical protein